MQEKQIQIELVEYNKNYANLDDIKKLFFTNYSEHMNLNKFAGIYLSMLAKYGQVTHLLLIMPSILIFGILFPLIALALDYSRAALALLCISIASIANYWIIAYYLVNRMYKWHLSYGKHMLTHFYDIDEKYLKDGGNFWLAVINDPNAKTKEIVGHLGFLKANQEKLKRNGVDINTKMGTLEAIGVNKKYRGLGIGKKLLEKAINFGHEQKFDKLDLGVYSVNTNSVELYKKYGFKVTGVFEIDKWTGLSWQRMVKELK